MHAVPYFLEERDISPSSLCPSPAEVYTFLHVALQITLEFTQSASVKFMDFLIPSSDYRALTFDSALVAIQIVDGKYHT